MKEKNKENAIIIKRARAHNLQNISLDIPRDMLTVVTGLSGSGKSSLVFDTIFAEAERRFVESLSSYARQFLGVKEKPDVDDVRGLSPAIAIDQKSIAKNPRSTVGTITEIYDHLRILFSRIGIAHCPQCGRAVKKQTIDEIVQTILRFPQQSSMLITAPVVRGRKGEHKKILSDIARQGFLRVRVDGIVQRVEEALDEPLNPKVQHHIAVIIDRLTIDRETEHARIADSVETAFRIGDGMSLVLLIRSGASEPEEIIFSERFACPVCHTSFPALEPRLFSFNSPYGACAICTGLGQTLKVDPDRVFPNKRLTLNEGAIRPWTRASHRVGRQSWYWWVLSELAKQRHFSLDVPIETLPPDLVRMILYGDPPNNFEGVMPNLERRWRETDSEWTRAEIEQYMKIERCENCAGKRLRPEALAVHIEGKSIADIAEFSVAHALAFFQKFSQKNFTKNEKIIADPLLKEITRRLEFLMDVGLEYLTLERSSTTLAGGEAQRVRLATQIGSGLRGVLYVLDEPSVGLHPRDHARLIRTILNLRDIGNTIIIVEHDAETMAAADWIIDLGPGAGRHGGKIVFEGSFAQLLRSKTSTGAYLSGKKNVHIVGAKRIATSLRETLVIRGAAEHNLRSINVAIPLRRLVCVTGVSGSGKSTLVNTILARALKRHFYGSNEEPGAYEKLDGIEKVDKAVVVDQSPIGRTPRSNPATYTGMFTYIRTLFARTRDARARGYTAGRFSFNVKGGRCEACEGHGVKKIEMYFLPDLYVECEECHGKRYNREALEIRYNDLHIADVLDFSCEDALKFFSDIPHVATRLRTLVEVGLGYMKLGQSAITLSGGEAQRVKLATELAKKATGNTFYILDEPTTGLHFEDIQKLLGVLSALVEKGNSVVVIEHNRDIIRNADWIIDLGPEGGDKGGTIVAVGTPSDIAANKNSYTGKWLKKMPRPWQKPLFARAARNKRLRKDVDVAWFS